MRRREQEEHAIAILSQSLHAGRATTSPTKVQTAQEIQMVSSPFFPLQIINTHLCQIFLVKTGHHERQEHKVPRVQQRFLNHFHCINLNGHCPHPPQILVTVWNLHAYTGHQMDSSPWRSPFSPLAGPRFLLTTLWKDLCIADASLYIHMLQVSSWTSSLEYFGGVLCPSLLGLEGEVRAGVLRHHLDAEASPSLEPKANRSLNHIRGQG